METSVTTEDLHEDDDQLVTRRDLRLLKRDLIDRVDIKFNELRDHFDATVENLVEQMRGASADQISLLRDTDENHERRLTAVERKIGLR